MSSSTSTVRVFVQWSEQTVFAGEDIQCKITFKNVASSATHAKGQSSNESVGNVAATNERNRKPPPSPIPFLGSNRQLKPPSSHRGHRPTNSLNISSEGRRVVAGEIWKAGSEAPAEERETHRRSVSIISLGQSEGNAEDGKGQSSNQSAPRRPTKGHSRAASLQIIPRRSFANGGIGPPAGSHAQRSATQPSPLFHNAFAFDTHSPDSTSNTRTLPRRSPDAGSEEPSLVGAVATPSFHQGFKFPAHPPTIDGPDSDVVREDGAISSLMGKTLPPRLREDIPAITEQSAPLARILSPMTHGETPRSSGDFYSLSNNSTETLASEYQPQQQQQQARLPLRPTHSRRTSNLSPAVHARVSETLMMGYAQASGSFVVDGSLIDQAPFEEVKRKGVLGGQGGGVIGIETNKRDSGMLRGFGWGNISESLSGLLGGGELSSMKEMRGAVSSKTIPLLSTPQSILFVDLKLAPGESRTYGYSFKIPKGLPPTHRGKAVKISYNIVIGTQRAGGAKEQQVKSVEIPFRVLGSVNSYGELLGHDLMSPHIILRDQARVHSIDSAKPLRISTTASPRGGPKDIKTTSANLSEFLGYVDELLSKPRQNSSLGLLSPTAMPESRRQSEFYEVASAKEAIDMAILRSNLATDQQQSANRFEIARGGLRVAVIMLARPAYRLGETVTAAIDFTDAQIPCYAIHASLETSEKVDASIAVRSEASINRVTRKIYSSHSESTLFARRVIFAPTIPTQATPSFITSAISLDWKLLIEFVTPRFDPATPAGEAAPIGLLEETSRDDRGVILAAPEMLDCESFEVAVPLRVYGALGGNLDQSSAEGLVV